MYIPSCFKSIQQISLANSAVGFNDINIPAAINVNNTMLMASFKRNDSSGFPDGNGSAYIKLLDSSTVRLVATLGGGDAIITIIEFYGGFLKQAVQYGTLNITGTTTKTGTITSVGSKAFVIPLGMDQATNAAQTDMGTQTFKLDLTNSTTVTGNRFTSGGVAGDSGSVIGYCVVDPR